MASTTGPDLDGARVAVENLMDDACIVTFDAEGVGDDVLDRNTGSLTPPAPDHNTVYDASTLGDGGRSLADEDDLGGKCKVQKASQSDIAAMVTEGGLTEGVDVYRFSVPWDAPLFEDGAVATIVSSRRDPELVDQTLRIRRAIFSTFLVSRRYLAEMRTP